MLGEAHVERFLAACRRRGDTRDTVDYFGHALGVFYAWWKHSGLRRDRIDVDCLDTYRQWLLDQPSPFAARLSIATVYSRLSALRVFFRYLARRKIVADDCAAMIVLPRRTKPLCQVLSEPELLRLCRGPTGKAPEAVRDRAYLELLVATAMRPAEAAELELADLDLSQQRVRIRRGKGDKLRWLPLTKAAVRALRSYRSVRRRILRPGYTTTRLFISWQGTFSNRFAVHIVARSAAAAGLAGHITPYTVRHSVATALARAGLDLRYLQALLGHTTPEATERYLHLGPQDLKVAHRRAHPRERHRSEPRARRRPHKKK